MSWGQGRGLRGACITGVSALGSGIHQRPRMTLFSITISTERSLRVLVQKNVHLHLHRHLQLVDLISALIDEIPYAAAQGANV